LKTKRDFMSARARILWLTDFDPLDGWIKNDPARPIRRRLLRPLV